MHMNAWHWKRPRIRLQTFENGGGHLNTAKERPRHRPPHCRPIPAWFLRRQAWLDTNLSQSSAAGLRAENRGLLTQVTQLLVTRTILCPS